MTIIYLFVGNVNNRVLVSHKIHNLLIYFTFFNIILTYFTLSLAINSLPEFNYSEDECLISEYNLETDETTQFNLNQIEQNINETPSLPEPYIPENAISPNKIIGSDDTEIITDTSNIRLIWLVVKVVPLFF